MMDDSEPKISQSPDLNHLRVHLRSLAEGWNQLYEMDNSSQVKDYSPSEKKHTQNSIF